MPTSIPPIHHYRFNGSAFVYRRTNPLFVLLAICGALLFLIIPQNNSVAYPQPSVSLVNKMTLPRVVSTAAEYILSVNDSLSERDALEMARYAYEAAFTFNHNLPVFLALVKVESGFKPEAFNKGAMGLTQVIPKWHTDRIVEARKRLGVYSIYEPKLNLYVGAWALRDFCNSSSSLKDCLLKYNGSFGDPAERYAKLVLEEAFRINNFFEKQAQKL